MLFARRLHVLRSIDLDDDYCYYFLLFVSIMGRAGDHPHVLKVLAMDDRQPSSPILMEMALSDLNQELFAHQKKLKCQSFDFLR